MTIFNSVIGTSGGGPKIPLNDISTLSAEDGGNSDIVLKWADVGDLVVNGVTANTWTATKLVRKTGSEPSSSSDGTLVTTSTTLNQYQTNGYDDTGLTDGTTYYYKAFSVGSNGLESGSNSVSAVPTSGWQPGANTIAYYPLTSTSTVNDESGNGHNLTLTGSISYGTTSGGAGYAIWNTSSFMSGNCIIPPAGPFTISEWINNQSTNGTTVQQFNSSTDNTAIQIGTGNNTISVWSKGSQDWDNISSVTQGEWTNIVLTYSSGTLNIYKNGVLAGTKSRTINTTTPNYFWINKAGETYNYGIGDGYQSNIIIEDKVRTAQEVSDYYDLTKGDYGL